MRHASAGLAKGKAKCVFRLLETNQVFGARPIASNKIKKFK